MHLCLVTEEQMLVLLCTYEKFEKFCIANEQLEIKARSVNVISKPKRYKNRCVWKQMGGNKLCIDMK